MSVLRVERTTCQKLLHLEQVPMYFTLNHPINQATENCPVCTA
jgi:hypothetical protein